MPKEWPDHLDGVMNLMALFEQADKIDMDEGMLAYQRYNVVMQQIAKRYKFTTAQVCAAFCSLSPNSDYFGNLRSTVSVLVGLRAGTNPDLITVSTYNHCKLRAIEYAAGRKDFLRETTGPKIKNFYMNILDPMNWQYVTIDGHMSAIWQGDMNMTMKEALMPKRIYDEIHGAVGRLAFGNFMLPNQMQATMWFTRKRLSRKVYDPQLALFADSSDVWKTMVHVDDIHPYPNQQAREVQEGMKL